MTRVPQKNYRVPSIVCKDLLEHGEQISMSKFYGYRRNSGCHPVVSSGGSQTSSKSVSKGLVEISDSVGQRGKNLAVDVRTIQDDLNRVRDDQGGASPDLIVDGSCGPKTIKAIQMFQLKHFGWSGADGLVEPNRQTLAKLNELLGGQFESSASPIGHPLPWKTSGQNWLDSESFRLAHKFILAALANLTSASAYLEEGETGGGLSVFSRSERMRLLNRHFEIDSFGSRKRVTYDFIYQHYFRMRQVFERPGGLWGAAAFVPDPTTVPAGWQRDAMAGRGGYYRGGEISHEHGHSLRIDSIYIQQSFFESSKFLQACTIVHELAHFVGHPVRITDPCYYWQPNYKTLNREVRIVNADNYTDFASDAGSGKLQSD